MSHRVGVSGACRDETEQKSNGGSHSALVLLEGGLLSLLICPSGKLCPCPCCRGV